MSITIRVTKATKAHWTLFGSLEASLVVQIGAPDIASLAELVAKFTQIKLPISNYRIILEHTCPEDWIAKAWQNSLLLHLTACGGSVAASPAARDIKATPSWIIPPPPIRASDLPPPPPNTPVEEPAIKAPNPKINQLMKMARDHYKHNPMAAPDFRAWYNIKTRTKIMNYLRSGLAIPNLSEADCELLAEELGKLMN